MTKNGIISLIRKHLATHLPKDAVAMIYGSQARGDCSENSDWDLLILLNRHGRVSPTELGEISFPIYELGASLGIEINPVILSSEEWHKRSFTPFYKNVTNESIMLWG